MVWRTQLFHLPSSCAAKELGISSTMLKKLCRHHSIGRWPYRKVRSLEILKEAIERDVNIPDDMRKVRISYL